jgi:rhomboid protease GluP
MADNRTEWDSPAQTETPILITSSMLESQPATRLDFESGMSVTPVFTIALIIANATVFIWELATGVLTSEAGLIGAGALVRDRVLHGEVWRLLSAAFLHASPGHIIGNCVMLYIVGMALEHAAGVRQTLLVYLTSAVAGGLMSVALSRGPSVGASGAIFGVVGAVVVILYQHRDRFHLRDNRVALVLAVYAAYTVVTGMASPFIDNAAHVGGFLGGALAGYFVEPRLGQES